MPDIIVKPSKPARDPKGTTAASGGFHGFSMKPTVPGDKGIKVGKAGRKLVKSDERDEQTSSREKYRNNYDKIFKKSSN